ncbi:hypothetical protein [uncultured Nonlabens sp.]|uniref:hypothetical protein n=1 Tax=uncultured Nonlabens sp. TaxID=859306 RepID=UPI0030D8B228|tara:strand:+ start:42650 stop:43864 length:1215 start_codon:yes stop_codon:yes gene_type:complete
MKRLLLIALLFSGIFSSAQISFKPGFFIENSGSRVDCIIKDTGSAQTPDLFKYKLNESGDILTVNSSDIIEIEVFNRFKYLKRTVDLDRSKTTSNISSLDENSQPNFNKENLLLKVLVEGAVSLYKYQEGAILKYFIQIGDGKINQLIYKRYKVKNEVGTNNEFKKQLFEALQCETIESRKFKNINYYKSDLSDLIIDYHECKKLSYIDYVNMGDKGYFRFNLKSGITFSKLSAIGPSSAFEFNFDNETSLRIGAELEYISSINNYKWAVFIEPTYQQYVTESEVNIRPDSRFPDFAKATADYRSIEIPIGLRHYLYLNDSSKLFIDGGYVIDMVLQQDVEVEVIQTDIVLQSKGNLFFGFGYKYQDKYSLAFRINTPRTATQESSSWKSDYSTTSIIFGYTIF